MKVILILFGLALTVTFTSAASEALIKFLTETEHKNLACATCRLLTPAPCPSCPPLEDISVCDIFNDVEHFTRRNITLSKKHESSLMYFRQACDDGAATMNIGNVLDEITSTPSFGQCVFCNMLLGVLHFVSDEILNLPPTLNIVCMLINGCTPDLIDAIVKGLRDSMVAFYTLIGVDLLNCPAYQDFIDGCVTNSD